MIKKKQEKQSGRDICVEILSGAATALTYTDEESTLTMAAEEDAPYGE